MNIETDKPKRRTMDQILPKKAVKINGANKRSRKFSFKTPGGFDYQAAPARRFLAKEFSPRDLLYLNGIYNALTTMASDYNANKYKITLENGSKVIRLPFVDGQRDKSKKPRYGLYYEIEERTGISKPGIIARYTKILKQVELIDYGLVRDATTNSYSKGTWIQVPEFQGTKYHKSLLSLVNPKFLKTSKNGKNPNKNTSHSPPGSHTNISIIFNNTSRLESVSTPLLLEIKGVGTTERSSDSLIFDIRSGPAKTLDKSPALDKKPILENNQPLDQPTPEEVPSAVPPQAKGRSLKMGPITAERFEALRVPKVKSYYWKDYNAFNATLEPKIRDFVIRMDELEVLIYGPYGQKEYVHMNRPATLKTMEDREMAAKYILSRIPKEMAEEACEEFLYTYCDPDLPEKEKAIRYHSLWKIAMPHVDSKGRKLEEKDLPYWGIVNQLLEERGLKLGPKKARKERKGGSKCLSS